MRTHLKKPVVAPALIALVGASAAVAAYTEHSAARAFADGRQIVTTTLPWAWPSPR
jgi:hypothetical protein